MLPDGAEKCAALLAVDAHKMERRNQLLKERDVLAEASDWLETRETGEW